MKLSDAFPSKYMKASDMPDEGSQPVTIEKIALEQIGRDKETKPVIYFEEFSQGLVLNKTNGRAIARLFGSEDFDDWIKKEIRIYRTETEYQGDIVDAIRVKGKPEKGPLGPKSVAITERAASAPRQKREENDEIPF